MSFTLCVDLDGTVMNNPIGGYVFPRVYKHFLDQGCDLSFQTVARMIDGEWHAQEDGPDPPHIALDWQFAAERVARKLRIRYELNWEELTIAGCQAGFISAIDNAPSVLCALRSQGARLVIATQGVMKYQRPVLETLGMWELFEGVLALDTTSCYKNQPGFWSGVAGDGPVVHVGDNFRQDVRGAQSCGIPVIWKNRHPTPEEQSEPDPVQRARIQLPPDGQSKPADAMITHLEQLPDALARLGFLPDVTAGS